MQQALYKIAVSDVERAVHVIDEAINYHRLWFDRLHASIICEDDFTEDILDIYAHTHCEFGQWYYGDVDETIRSFSEYEQIESVHKYMHDHARQIALMKINHKPVRHEDYDPFLANQHRMIDLLVELRDKLIEHQFCFDVLTETVNRKSISLLLEQEFKNALRYDLVYSVAMVDIDHFKQINDTYGHINGDQVLRQTGALLKQSLRDSDCVGRYGGEEFLIILPGTGHERALEVMEHCRQRLAEFEISLQESTLNITCSIGVSQLDERDSSAWQVVRRADDALYLAKERGRNRVVAS